MIKTVLGLVFDSRPIQALLAVLGIAGLVGAFAWEQRSIGAAKAEAKIERKTTHAIQLGNSGARGSLDGSVRGERDPSYRARATD